MKCHQWTCIYILLPMLIDLAFCLPVYSDYSPVEKRNGVSEYSQVLNPLLSMLMERQQIERTRRGLNADMGLGSRWSSIEQLANQILAREHLFSAASPGRR